MEMGRDNSCDFLPAVKDGREWVHSRHTPTHEISADLYTLLTFVEKFTIGRNPKKIWCPVVD